MGKSKDKVLFFETKMDKRPSCERSSIKFMESFFKKYADFIDFKPEMIHSRVDLSKFLDEARKYNNLIKQGRRVNALIHTTC